MKKASIRNIESSLESVTRANNDLEQYTRRECMEIRGIPVAATPSEEQTNNIVKDVGKLLGVDITEAIECLKQLKDLTTRDLGYSEKNKIYLAESLTERNRMLFKDCLKVKKDMEFKFIWTLNGKIFMRKDKDSAVHHINN
ncbi:unnamed protein product, partial [Porites lobata]